MHFIGTILLLLSVLPSLYFSKCECMNKANGWGEGKNCDVDNFCYVNKQDCRAERLEVFETGSKETPFSNKLRIGHSFDICLPADEKIHKTKFCGCLDKKYDWQTDRSCNHDGWCYVNKRACSEFLSSGEIDPIINAQGLKERDPEMVGISHTICQNHMRINGWDRRCECSEFNHTDRKCRVKNWGDCFKEGVELDDDRSLYWNSHMYEIETMMEKHNECRCLQGTHCYDVDYRGAAPYCIVDREICENEGFLVTPLQKYHNIGKARREPLGVSQQFCMPRKDRYKKKEPEKVEVLLEGMKWVLVGSIARGQTIMQKETNTETEVIMGQTDNQTQTITKSDKKSTTQHHWKVGVQTKASVKVGYAQGETQYNLEGGGTYGTESFQSNIDDYLNREIDQHTYTKTKTIEIQKGYEKDNTDNRLVYKLQFRGKTLEGKEETIRTYGYEHVCYTKDITENRAHMDEVLREIIGPDIIRYNENKNIANQNTTDVSDGQEIIEVETTTNTTDTIKSQPIINEDTIESKSIINRSDTIESHPIINEDKIESKSIIDHSDAIESHPINNQDTIQSKFIINHLDTIESHPIINQDTIPKERVKKRFCFGGLCSKKNKKKKEDSKYVNKN